MAWQIIFTKSAQKDLTKLDSEAQKRVLKLIKRVSENPLPQGGYGKPLGGKLAGYLKIKLKNPPLRIVYKVEVEGEIMRIVIIGFRSNDDVYREVARRLK